MGNFLSLETQLKCKKLECGFSSVLYQSIIIYPYIITYENLKEHISSHVLKEYFNNAYHHNSYTYIIFNACEICVKEELKKYFKFNKDGFTKYKWN